MSKDGEILLNETEDLTEAIKISANGTALTGTGWVVKTVDIEITEAGGSQPFNQPIAPPPGTRMMQTVFSGAKPRP